MASNEMKILSPTAILGYGFPEESFALGLQRKPDVIAVDAGSSDPGPYYLGAGVSFTDRSAVMRDLTIILKAARDLDIPVLVGSAGGSGASPHLAWTLDIVKEVCVSIGYHAKVAAIDADVPRSTALDALSKGTLTGVIPEQETVEKAIAESTYIVGQMGEEPLIAALDSGARVVVAGRCYDPAVFAALPILEGFDRGLALHLGKILECAAIAALPGSGSDCMLGTLAADHFVLEPTSPSRVCTITSVAAHTLYEKSDPYFLPGPGGHLDLTETRFEQLDARRVKVSGSRFVQSDGYRIKLEGARKVGYRTVSIAGVRDPVFISRIDEILAGVRARVADNFSHVAADAYSLLFHIYGKNGVMGALEPVRNPAPHELGIVIEAVAQTQDLANTICSFTRSTALHFGYEGRVSTAGNLAFPYSPSDFKGGEVYEFSLYHLLEVADPTSLFPIRTFVVGGAQ
ncbi:acyclic terpene utilization AtuA family protein [Rhizobium leguminosarum]